MSSIPGDSLEAAPTAETFSSLDNSLLLASFVLTFAGAAAPEHSKAQYALFGLAGVTYVKPAVSALRDGGSEHDALPPEVQHDVFGLE